MEKAKPKRIVGPWTLPFLQTVPRNNLTVFSCFHCGGGSTMGYKLAGFNVLGGVEIDPEMMEIYRANHQPKHSYLMGVQQFNKLPLHQIPDEIKQLDILDGSPPCSVFSLSGKREKKWGGEHYFREGQQKQRLDDLFMHFIEVGRRLKPKVIVAENVKGLIMGNAKGYVKEIFTALKDCGYDAQLFLFNSSRMGVPQARERAFFIARQSNLCLPPLKMHFSEKTQTVQEAFLGITSKGRPLSSNLLRLYHNTLQGDTFEKAAGGGSYFNYARLSWNSPSRTLTSTQVLTHPKEPRFLSNLENVRLQSFPDDYNFINTKAVYLCGMSVPPFMMQRVAFEIGRQWFGCDYE